MKPAAAPARIDVVSHWKRIGRELERVRLWELRHYNFEEHRATIDALLQTAHERARQRSTSGLVQLQRLLAKGGR